MNHGAYINQISTAVPDNECHGAFAEWLTERIPDLGMRNKLNHIVERLGIQKRYSVVRGPWCADAEDFYAEGKSPSTEQRMKRYQKEAFPLVERAVRPLGEQYDLREVTHLIVTSCTGFYAPGIDIDIVQRLGLRPDVQRTLIGYMGCYAAVPALRLANSIVNAQPTAKVLTVNVELCSLHWREDVPLDQLLSFLLFSDGCAASLVTSKAKGIHLKNFYSHLIPDTLSMMKWDISDRGFYMTLDSKIPEVLQTKLPELRQAILHQIPKTDYRFWAVHPGGRSIVDAVETSLQLKPEHLSYSRAVLQEFGNMSSATLMFVLKKILDSQLWGLGVGMAFGPGLSAETFTFHCREVG